MNLSRPILKGLSQVGFVQPTPIQVQTIPIALMGRDICGGAITGSGKTAAFIVPILERLLYRPRQTPAVRVLILAPTRELAIQCHSVGMRLASFTDTTFCLCVGGLSLKVQEIELRQRPDIVIATPGRLIDHVRNSPSFTLDTIEILVVDEADRVEIGVAYLSALNFRMLEDGFASELNEIIKNCPKSRQTLLFSATMTDNVDELIRLSLNRPVRLMVDPAKAFAARLTQEFVRIRKNHEEDRKAILLALCYRNFKNKTIIFLRSKALAHEMKIIFGLIGLKAAELHGNLSQEQRLEALEGFRDGNVDFLLATDLASRGLDIKGIQTVINYDMPQSYAHYLHRVGRTARAGRNGRSVTFSGESDRKILKTIIKHSLKEQIKRRIVPTDVIFKFRRKIVEIRDQVNEVLAEEKKGKEIRQVEIELAKSENLLKHEQEIYSRPARTWFQTEKEKQQAKEILGGKYVGQDQNGKKRKRTGAGEEKSASLKPKMTHGKFAGLPRAKKRRLQLQEQEQLDSANKIATIKSIKLAKKELKPTRITQLPSGQKLGNNKKTKPKSKDKQRAQVRFDMDLADVSKKSASAVIKKPRSAKKNPAKSSAKKGIINETRYKSSSRKRGIKKFGSKGNNRSTKFSGGSKKSRK
ncbi:hypothetical protein G9A89_004176 [Geosiphon pyriformis]|nr:hypothetical protein G9A89_004176 [Geosiphon pyriformis]